MSVLATTKSDRHRKTHEVEPDGMARKFTHLTRGGLLCESAGEVSRGRSSEEAGETQRSEGPKNQTRESSRMTLKDPSEESSANETGATTTVSFPARQRRQARLVETSRRSPLWKARKEHGRKEAK